MYYDKGDFMDKKQLQTIAEKIMYICVVIGLCGIVFMTIIAIQSYKNINEPVSAPEPIPKATPEPTPKTPPVMSKLHYIPSNNRSGDIDDKVLWEPCDKRHNASFRYMNGCTGSGSSSSRPNQVNQPIPETRTFWLCMVGLGGVIWGCVFLDKTERFQ